MASEKEQEERNHTGDHGTTLSHESDEYSWSDLPPELLKPISDHLKSNSDDILQLRAVCKNWRSAVPMPLLHLHPMLPYKSSNPDFLIVSSAVYLVRAQHRENCQKGWLITVEQASLRKLRLRLFHTLNGETRRPSRHFPKIPRPPVSAILLSKDFMLREFDQVTPVLHPNFKHANKVLFWPNPNIDSANIVDSSLMVLRNTGALVCYDGSNFGTAHSIISYESINIFDDIVLWKDCVLALGPSGRLFQIDYNNRTAATVLVSTPIDTVTESGRRNRMLVSDDQVYLVAARGDDSNPGALNFRVYKLNENRDEWLWEELTSLGDCVLIVNLHTCFFVRAKDLFLHGFSGNRIVYCVSSFRLHCTASHYDTEVVVHNYGEEGSCQNSFFVALDQVFNSHWFM